MGKREFQALGAELQQALHQQTYMQRMRRSIKAEISVTDAKGEMHVLYDNHWSEEQAAEYIVRARGKVSPWAPDSAAQIGGYIQQSPSVPAGPIGYVQQSHRCGGDRQMYGSGAKTRAMANRMPNRWEAEAGKKLRDEMLHSTSPRLLRNHQEEMSPSTTRNLQPGGQASRHSPRARLTYGEENLYSDREENEQISCSGNAPPAASDGRHDPLDSTWSEEDLRVLPMPKWPARL